MTLAWGGVANEVGELLVAEDRGGCAGLAEGSKGVGTVGALVGGSPVWV